MAPKVSIIIPNWNGLQHLQTCLSSLRKQSFKDYEVFLVDNNSSDDSVEYVREHFPEVRLEELDQNLGFTGACNRGLELSTGEFVILLNNDTEVDPAWLFALVEAFDRYPQAGILACKILLFERRDHFHSAGDSYGVDGIPSNRGVWHKDAGQFDQEEEVFSACGAAAAYRREMVEEIGFLDDRYYFSCEDVDISWRAHLAGWKVVYIPDAVVYHKLKATGGSVTGSYYDGRNFLYLIWKNYPLSLLIRFFPAIFRAQASITIKALRSWRGKAARARLRGQIAGIFSILWAIPERRRIQANRRISDERLMSLLSPVDRAENGG